MQKHEFSVEIGGKELTATFTDLANQAHGSVLLRYGDTSVLATAVMSDSARSGINYFPLTVDYEEKFYAAGQILGSRFMRREGRPSDEAVLSGRAVDRCLRPLFDQSIRNDVQVVITVLSIADDDPDVLAINAASLALATSDIPWDGPVSAVRVGKQKNTDEWTVNPTYEFRNTDEHDADLLVCGKDGLINMIESGAHEASEKTVVSGLTEAAQHLTELEEFQKRVVQKLGKQKREDVLREEIGDDVRELFDSELRDTLESYVFADAPGKSSLKKLAQVWKKLVEEKLPDADMNAAGRLLDEKIDEALHKGVLEKEKRPDGRALGEVRPLFAQAGGVSSMLHGSGIFYRGGTHIFSALTLGGPQDSLIVEGMEVQVKKRFMHHYNFPPFSVGETGRIGGFNRRMIGHGALAEKALRAVIPTVETFPYTIRIVSEALASNGSTSMGSVCGSTLALMDAGVPISTPVAGIAMGLILGDEEYKILTDIQGPEDHHGDMDLKVAGTKNGITAMQMDVKVAGVSLEILTEALEHAKRARETILETITSAIPEPRKELNPNAPHIAVIHIKPDQIGLVIGSGGKTVNAIKDLTDADIDIEEDGTVFITGSSEGVAKAQKLVEQITHEFVVGEKVDGVVTRVVDFGAFVRISAPNELDNNHDTEGLVHISQIAPFRIESVSDILKVGDTVPVVVKEIDERGRINLSIKDADPNFAQHHAPNNTTRKPASGEKSRRG